MYKRLSAVMAISLVCAGLFVFSYKAKSDTVTYGVTSGIDNTAGTMKVFSANDLVQVGTSDNSRNGTTDNWPYVTAYDESKYVEFDFTPNISSDAVISAVTITHQYYTQVTLSGAKLEVWDGSIWQDIAISLPSKTGSGGEILETKDISTIVSSPTVANSLKIRFLAYRSTNLSSVANLKTFHNYISASIVYLVPTATPSDSVTITPTSSPSDSISPDASASATIMPTPNPDVSVVPTPSPTPPPIFIPSTAFSPDPEDITASESISPTASAAFETPSPSPIASPLITPTPDVAPSASFEPTPNPLVAVIAPPKIIHYRPKSPPFPSILIMPSPKPVSRIRRVEMTVVDIWHLFTHYINMIGR